MNLALGGTTYPGEVQVDYVRIYTPTTPLRISVTRINSAITQAGPGNIVCHLQAQTSSLATNRTDVVIATNSLSLTPANNAAFYRWQSP